MAYVLAGINGGVSACQYRTTFPPVVCRDNFSKKVQNFWKLYVIISCERLAALVFAHFLMFFRYRASNKRFFTQTNRRFRILRRDGIRPHNRSIPNNRKRCKSKMGKYPGKFTFFPQKNRRKRHRCKKHAKI